LLGINRSSLYYQDKPPEIADIDLLNIIRDVWCRRPFYGYRRITKELQESGLVVNRKRIQRIMKLGGIKAIYPGPNTSKRNKQHAVHPYLLKGLTITRANQAWMVDITYLRTNNGFMYLVALIDVYSRYVMGWTLSNSLETSSCIDALKKGLSIAKPEIINSHQGSQFTSDEWVKYLQAEKIKISMTGKGRCLDNIYIERFWRSFKREEFYLNDYSSIKELRQAIGAYVEFYNHKRWHQSLGYKTPADIYYNTAGRSKEAVVDSTDWGNKCEAASPKFNLNGGLDIGVI
jgi:putative transposase